MRATQVDLQRVEGRAELIGGRAVKLRGGGHLPSEVAANIMVSLRKYARGNGGIARTCGLIYRVPETPAGRESFCADASYSNGPRPTDRMGPILGPPTFAVELRHSGDFDAAGDRAFAAKRADYFLAGTLAVWDVDPLAETVALYRAADPLTPVAFRRGDTADAEPAVPGWRIAVADVFAV